MTLAGLLALSSLTVSASPVSAASCTWNGSDGDWETAGNWSCGAAPDGDDTAFIGSGTVTLSTNISVGALTVSGGRIDGAGSLTVNGAFSKGSGATFFVTNDGLGGKAPDLVLNGAATLEGGYICVARSDDADPDLPNLHINSTFSVVDGPDSVAFPLPCTAGPRIHVNAPNGHLVKSTAGTTSFGVGIENDGTLTVAAGTLDLSGGTIGITSDGAFIANAGTTLKFSNANVIGATGRVGGAGTIDVQALDLVLAAGATLDPAVLNFVGFGVMRLDGTTPLTLPAVTMNGGGFNPTFDTDRPVTATSLSVAGAGTLGGSGSLTVPAGGTFTKTGTGPLTITNAGAGAADLVIDVDATLAGGSICVQRFDNGNPDPSLHINQDLTIGAGADTAAFSCGGVTPHIHVNGPDGRLLKAGSGTTGSQGAIAVAGGTVTIGAGQTLALANGLVQSGGLTEIATGGVLQGFVTLNGGVLRGGGQVSGNLSNSAGTVRPGGSPGTLTVSGAYTQGSGATLEVDINGTNQGTDYDHLSVGGAAALGGTLTVLQGAGFDPQLEHTFQFITSASRTGSFAALTGSSLPSGRIYALDYPGSPEFGARLVVQTGTLPVCTEAPFSDVPTDHPFCPEISWMKDNEISTGFDDGTYRPAIAVTRQAMSAFMARLAGATLPACTTAPFSDVPSTHPFCKEIQWMKDEGISTGFDDGTYRPSIAVTRQAMSAFMARLAEASLTACTEAPFSDVLTSHPFCQEIKWMKVAEISTGFGDGTYRPATAVTRQAMSAFMYRVSALLP